MDDLKIWEIKTLDKMIKMGEVMFDKKNRIILGKFTNPIGARRDYQNYPLKRYLKK